MKASKIRINEVLLCRFIDCVFHPYILGIPAFGNLIVAMLKTRLFTSFWSQVRAIAAAQLRQEDFGFETVPVLRNSLAHWEAFTEQFGNLKLDMFA